MSSINTMKYIIKQILYVDKHDIIIRQKIKLTILCFDVEKYIQLINKMQRTKVIKKIKIKIHCYYDDKLKCIVKKQNEDKQICINDKCVKIKYKKRIQLL